MLLALSVAWLALAGRTGLVTGFFLPSIVIGAALGAAFVTTTQLAVRGVAESESGLAGGLVNTAQQVGGALGLAALGGLAATRSAALTAAGSSAADAAAGGFQLVFLGVAALAAAGVVIVVTVRGRR